MNDLSQHLSEDQFEALLLGDATAADAAHVAACSLCREREEQFSSLIANFNQSTLEWAHARSQHAFAAGPEQARAARLRPYSLPAYAFAAALLLLLTLALSHFALRHGSSNVAQFSQLHGASAALAPLSDGGSPVASPADPQITADNQLLAEIDSALDQPDPAPVPAAGSTPEFAPDPQPGTPSPR